jgi:hypothetical protein
MKYFHGKLKKFVKLPNREKVLFLEALVLQYSVWLMLKVLPFRTITVIFKNPTESVPYPDIALLTQISSTIKYASHLSLWKNKCLIMSLTTRWMLKKRKITSELSLGADIIQKEKFTAHAWIKAEGMELVKKNGEWKELYSF